MSMEAVYRAAGREKEYEEFKKRNIQPIAPASNSSNPIRLSYNPKNNSSSTKSGGADTRSSLLQGNLNYSSVVKYLEDKGVYGASGILTKNEWRRRNKSGGTYEDYLKSMVSKYENGIPYSTKTNSAYTAIKDKANSQTVKTSTLSDKERKDRIRKINSEMRSLQTKISGYSRAKVYGTSKAMQDAEEKDKARLAELSEELKSLERVGTYSASQLKRFEIDDAKAEVSRANQKVQSYGARPTANNAEEWRQANLDLIKTRQNLDTLERQKELYEDIVKFGDVVNQDNNKSGLVGKEYPQWAKNYDAYMKDFESQWRANYRSNELSREADKAMSAYLTNPTEENLQIAYAYDALARAYAQNNAEALDDENVKMGWLTKSAAGYLPQFKDQIVPEVIGGGIGGLVGSVVGAPSVGMSVGAAIGTFTQSYDVMRGSVYRALLAEGVDEEIARGAAEDEAVISSLIESGETAATVLLLGGGKALSAIANAAKASVASGSANAATRLIANLAGKATGLSALKAATKATSPLWKKGLSVAGGLVGNALTEYGEEFTQGAVSRANIERALSENAVDGKGQLLQGTGKVLGSALSGKDPEALSELHSQGVEGFKIGLMFGGSTALVNNIVTQYSNAKTVKAQNEIIDAIIEDEESLDILIDEGKASGEGTVSAKIAEEIEIARENGKEVTREQVKKLIASNEVYIENETITSSTPKEQVKTSSPGATESVASNVVVSKNTTSNPTSIEDVKKASGFGENGAKLLNEIAVKDGMTFIEARDAMKVAYLAGYNGDNTIVKGELQNRAKLAGIDDRIIDNNIALEKVKNATVYEGTFTENEFTKDFTSAEKKMISTFAKSLRMDVSVVDKIIANVVNGVEYEANASQIDGKMEISNNRSADKVIHSIVMHESGHRMRQLAPTEFGILMDALYERSSRENAKLGKSQTAGFDNIKTEYDNAKILKDTSGYLEEFAVRELESIFASPEDFNKWYDEINGNQQVKTAWEKIVDFIHKVFDDIKSALAQSKMSNEVRAEATAELDRIKELYTNAFKAAEKAVADRTNAIQNTEINAETTSDPTSSKINAANKETPTNNKNKPQSKIKSAKVGDVYKANSTGKTYIVTGRNDTHTTYTVTDNNGKTTTRTTTNNAADINFNRIGKDGFIKVESNKGVKQGDVFIADKTDTSYKIVSRDNKNTTVEITSAEGTNTMVVSNEIADKNFNNMSDKGITKWVKDEDHIDNRSWDDVGSRKVKAFQFLFPEMKDYYKPLAQELIGDLDNTIQGERMKIGSYEMSNEEWVGIERFTSETIAAIKDDNNVSYDDIRNALERLIADDGQENVALAKRIELVLDDMLTKGYKTFDGTKIPANEEYITKKEALIGKTYEGRSVEDVSDEMVDEWVDFSTSFSLKNKNLNINSRIPFTVLNNYINVANGKYSSLKKLEKEVKNIKRDNYQNDATGYQARITSDTIGKAIRPTTDENFSPFTTEHINNLNAMRMLPELFKKAVYVDSMPPQKGKNQNPSYKEFHHFVAPLFMNNGEYRAIITAREKVNSNTLYVLRVEVLPTQKRHTLLATQQNNAVGSQSLSVPLNTSIPELVNGVKIFNYDTNAEGTYTSADINFSLKKPIEETKNLVAVHNMQSSELERTLDLGGLPMPSIAIIKAQNGHSEYGDVSLVFDKSVIDPRGNKANKVYGGDAWTPTYPQIEYKPNDKIAKKISDKYYELSRKYGYDESRPLYNYVHDLENQLNRNKGEAGMLEELYNDTRVMQFYLLDSGKGKIETINKETRRELTDAEVKMHEFFINELGADVVDEVKWDGKGTPMEHRQNYMTKYGDAIREAYKKLLIQDYQFSEEEVQNVLDSTKTYNYMKFVRDAYNYRKNGRVTVNTEPDNNATENAIKEAAGEDYRKWVDSLFKGVEEKSGIRNNADYFTNSGNRRSWEALHWENNLENVVKVMKGQEDVGGSAIFAGHNIWGVAAKNYRSIDEIKADSERLKQLPQEEYNKIKEGFGERLSEIAQSIMDKSERNPFIAVDNAMECIIDAVRNSKTKSGILSNLKQYQHLNVTEITVDDIVSLVSDIANMPTEYFEAKPKRAVGLNEIATAIIPDNTSEATKARLNDMGISYLEYETGNEEARLETLNSLEELKFSLKGGLSDTEIRNAISNNNLSKYVEKGVISTERYNELVKIYGAIEAGENPHREVSVPKKTAKNKNVSQTVRTILEAKATPDEAVPTIEKMVEDGVFSYDVYTDKQAIKDSEDYLNEYGWVESLSDWLDDVNKGVVSKQHTAMGWALYNNAANTAVTATSEAERKTAIQTSLVVLDGMVRHQRSAAQALQATRILKKLSPDTQLYGVQKSVTALQEELTEKYGKKAPDLKIDEELAEQFLTAETAEEREAIQKEIYKDIGRQMPSRFIDKWNAWRYLAMLGNVRTHGRNIIGNAAFAPVVATKNLTATVIESVVHRVSGKKTLRGKSLIFGNKTDRSLLKAAWGDYGNVAEMISNGGKYNDSVSATQQIEEGRQIFKFKPLEWARKANSKALEAEDVWFSKPHYAFALAQYCKANNITAEQIERGKAIAPAREYAIKEAQKATYRDTNDFSQWLSELGRNHNGENKVKKAVGTIVEGILPFRKTPANILVRGVEYSPIGLVKSLSYDLVQVGKGKMTATEAIDNISAGLTGTGLLGLGVYLAAQGLIRGHGEDDEKEKEFNEMMGHQAYSLELPNGQSITLDWLAPEALPFFVGVNLWETTKGTDENVNMAKLLSSITNITEPMLEMSCLQGLNDLFEGIGYASTNDTSGLVKVISSALQSYFSQGIPTLSGQAERTSEENRMTTYTEKNGFLTSDMQYALGKISAKIPGWDYNQIPYIDAWGRKEASGTALKRGLNNFLNPAYTSTIETSEIEKELLRLYEQTGEASVFPKRAYKDFKVDGEDKYLTAEEYVRYATLKGEKSYSLVTELLNSKAYKTLSDEEKVIAIDDAYKYADQKAKEAISNYKPENWVGEADAFGNDVEKYFSFYASVSDTKSDNGGKITKKEIIDIIVEQAENDSDVWNMYLSHYDYKEAHEAHDLGIDAKLYITTDDVLYNMKADYIYNGKRVDGADLTTEEREKAKVINGSKKAKVQNYLNSVCTNEREYMYLYGTVYDSIKDDYAYVKLFGKK